MAANINKKEIHYWVAINHIPGIGPAHFKKILDIFKSAKGFWESSEKEISYFTKGEKLKKSILDSRKKLDPEELYNRIINQGIKLITIGDTIYPSLLKQIYDPPPLLYCRGDLDFAKSLFFGIVGTRKITNYGIRAIEKIVAELVSCGLVIVSGLARGGDTIAHKASLKTGGKTVAVLGSGVNVIYPAENKKLALEIEKNGAVVSEFPPNSEPRREFFPIRNRIISGLSLGLLVVEATEKSGTLITANCALEQNREVFALPGSIFNPFSRGPAKLIKMGAKLVYDVEDILEELNIEERFKKQKAREVIPENKEEEIIIKLLRGTEKLLFDEIVRQSKLNTARVSSLLTVMELKGKIKKIGGEYVLER